MGREKRLSIGFGLVWVFSQAIAGESVTIRADTWFPHNGDPKSTSPGYMVEIAQAVFGENGVAVNYDTMPWERALDLTRKGDIDCVVGAAKTDAPDFAFPTQAQGKDQTAFFVKRGASWKYEGVPSLERVRMAVIDGYSYTEDLDTYIAKNKGTAKVQSVSGDTPLAQNIKKLLAGRVDVLVESRAVFASFVSQQKQVDQFAEAGLVGEPTDLYVACSPSGDKGRRMAAILSDGMAKLRQSGRLEAILKKYDLSGWM